MLIINSYYYLIILNFYNEPLHIMYINQKIIFQISFFKIILFSLLYFTELIILFLKQYLSIKTLFIHININLLLLENVLLIRINLLDLLGRQQL